MDSRFFITVALDRASYQKTLKDFKQIQQAAMTAQQAAFGVGKGAKASATQIKTAVVEATRLSRALRGVSAPGVAPFKAINTQLKASIVNARALKRILSAPTAAIPAIYGQRYKELGQLPGPTGGGIARYPQALITDQRWRYRQALGTAGYTMTSPGPSRPLTPASRDFITDKNVRNIERAANSYAAINQAANENLLTQDATRKGTKQWLSSLGTAIDEKTRIKQIDQELFGLQDKHKKLLDQERAISRKAQQAEFAGNKERAKAYSEESRQLTQRRMQNIQRQKILRDEADTLREMVTGRKSAAMAMQEGTKQTALYGKQIDNADKRGRQFTKTQKDMGKNQSFINSRFGRFSIIMSGLAATLFVWQNIVHVVRSVVGVGVELETTFINIADKIGLSVHQLEMFEKQAREAGKTGVIKAPEFGEYALQLTQLGFSLERSSEMIQQVVDHQQDLFDDTVAGNLKEAAGLFREIAAMGYEFAEGPLISGLQSLNNSLRNITDSVTGWQFLTRSIDFAHKALSTFSVTMRLARGWVSLIWEKTGALDALKSGWEKVNDVAKKYHLTQIDIGAAEEKFEQIVSRMDQPAIAPGRLGQASGYEDFDTQYGNMADSAADFADSMQQGFKTVEELEKFIKSISKDLKKAAEFFGFIPENLKRIDLKEINDQIERLAQTELFSRSQLEQYRKSFVDALDLKGLQPGLKIHREYFNTLGIVTKDYYDSIFKAIDTKAEQSLIKLQGYAKQIGQTATQAVTEPVSEDFDLKMAIKEAADKAGVDEKLFTSLIKQESAFDPYAISEKGAIGLTQLMPSTAAGLGVDPLNIRENLEGGARYLKQQLDDFATQELALAAYNAGPGAVRKYGGVPPFKETQDFVARIQQNLERYGEFEVQLRPSIQMPSMQGGIRQGDGLFRNLEQDFKKAVEGINFADIDLDFKTFQEQFKALQRIVAPSMKILQQQYNDLGVMSQAYYDNEVLKLKNNMVIQAKVLQASGVEQSEAESIARRLFNREKYLLTLQKIYSKELGLSKDHVRALEQIFEETGYYAPELERKQRLDTAFTIRRIQGQITGGDETGQDPFLAGLPTQQDLIKAATINAKAEIEIFENRNKLLLESAQKYYDATEMMTDEHYQYRKTMIQLEDELLQAQGATPEQRAIIRNRKELDLEKERNKARIDLHEQYFQVTGQMSQAFYNWQENQIEEHAKRAERIIGKDMAARIEQQKKAQLEIQRLLADDDPQTAFSSAVEARTLQVESNTKTAAQSALEYIKRFVDGSQNIIEDQIFDTLQGEFDSIEGFFKSLNDSFKAMVNQMAADILAAQLGKLLFGELAEGIPGFTGGGGGGASATGIVGSLVGVVAGLFGGGGGAAALTGRQKLLGVATGGAFMPTGAQTKFAVGGVIDTPTIFPYATGTGLMGEAGPEGILPLRRTKSGKLGVEFEGGGQTIISPTIIVQAPEGRIPRESMNQITSRLSRTLAHSTRRNN